MVKLNRLLLRQITIPSILKKILIGGSVLFAPTAIGVGVGVVGTDPMAAIWWFSSAGASALLGFCLWLWDEIQWNLGWRLAFSIVTGIIVLFSVARADRWVADQTAGEAWKSMLQAADDSRTRVAQWRAEQVVIVAPSEQHVTEDKVEAKPQYHSPKPVLAPEAFSVAVEIKLMVPGPEKDYAGTGFWGLSTFGGNCYLRSADVVMLIRIKSLEPTKTMITAYNVYGLGGELIRIKMTNGIPVEILGRGVIPANFTGTLRLPMPSGSGNANASLVAVNFADTDFSVAMPMKENILDREIADRYLSPGDTVRGWSFFEYPGLGSIPVKLVLKISDDLGHTFSFEIPDEPGNPGGDALVREFVFTGPPMNLSSCVRQPHPAPLP